jgi:hypothetical protein
VKKLTSDALERISVPQSESSGSSGMVSRVNHGLAQLSFLTIEKLDQISSSAFSRLSAGLIGLVAAPCIIEFSDVSSIDTLLNETRSVSKFNSSDNSPSFDYSF